MRLADWLQRDRVVGRLIATGMRRKCAELAAPGFTKSASALVNARISPRSEVAACWVPGRIEVLGKHTDYCGGRSLLAAAERGFSMIAARRQDEAVTIIDAGRSERTEFGISADLQPAPGSWSNYPRTVAGRLARNFRFQYHGATIAFSSNLPPSAGMSSSSALLVGTYLMLSELHQLSRHPVYRDCIRDRAELAGYLGCVENGSSYGSLHGDRGVGTFGGSEDHTAMLCGHADKLVIYSFCPVRHERTLDLDERYVLAVASSGMVAEKTGEAQEKYNCISLLAQAIVERWRHVTGRPDATLAAVLSSALDADVRLRKILHVSKHAQFSADELLARLEQFEIEDHLITSLPSSIGPATSGDFAKLVSQSQEAAETLLGNQVPETTALVRLAEAHGAVAATAFGAGFGGSVWALIEAADEATFLRNWRKAYLEQFPRRLPDCTFFASRPGIPAVVWGLGNAG